MFIVTEYAALKKYKLEDLTVLKRSPDLLNNVKIGQDQYDFSLNSHRKMNISRFSHINALGIKFGLAIK